MKHRQGMTCVAAAFSLMAVGTSAQERAHDFETATPIKHLVVIFQENISFDHYFGTYPKAENKPGETPFKAKGNTPRRINNLLTPLDVTNRFRPLRDIDLLEGQSRTPTRNAPIGADHQWRRTRPIRFRLSPAQALTADQGHNYHPRAAGLRQRQDGWVPGVHRGRWSAALDAADRGAGDGLLRRQHGHRAVELRPALRAERQQLDHDVRAFDAGGDSTSFRGRPTASTPSLNVVDGSRQAAAQHARGAGRRRQLHLIGDGDPLLDVCSSPPVDQITMHGRNIGDLLNAKNISWGWFEGGFDLTITNANGTTGCARETDPTAPGTPAFTSTDYIPHHEPFQDYASTRNPTHARPTFDRCDRSQHGAWLRRTRAGQSSIRHQRFLLRPEGGRPAVGELPQGAGVSGRACRLFRSARRAALPGARHQCSAVQPVLGRYRGDHRLRRFRRMVRSPDAAGREPVLQPSRCVERHGRLRQRPAAGTADARRRRSTAVSASRRKDAVATAHGCRCWSFHHTRGPITWIIR